jgi:hypothetical protein
MEFETPPGLIERMEREQRALEQEQELLERVWRGMITKCPELEHAVLHWPDPPWYQRLWGWLVRKVTKA